MGVDKYNNMIEYLYCQNRLPAFGKMKHFGSYVLKSNIFDDQIFVLKIFFRPCMAGQMLLCFIHYQNAILHVQVMVKCSKTLVTKKTWGRVMRVKNRMFGWKFSKVTGRSPRKGEFWID